MRFISCFLLSAAVAQAGVHFEPNRGQADARFALVARTPGGLIGPGIRSIEFARPGGERASIRFERASSRACAKGIETMPGVSHYAEGSDQARWLWEVPHYGGAQVSDLYPGVDLLFRTTRGSVEFDFELEPGADASQIRLRFSGPVRLTDSGELQFGTLRLRPPQAWQEMQGGRAAVDVRFVVDRRNRATFALGRHDRSRPLIIDPVVDFATYLGGSSNDGNPRILAAPDGAIYMAGDTLSPDFPAALPDDNPLNRPEAFLLSTVFVARFKKDASSLDWSLFVGGTAQQNVLGLDRDGLGNIYLLGKTTSPNLPVTPGAYRAHIGAYGSDFFVMKLDGATGRILSSTFLGISQSVNMGSISALLAVDFAGGIYVASGFAPGFTPTPGALQTTLTSSGAQACILRLNSAATAAVYATYWPLGGIGVMEVDPSGNLVVGGLTAGGSGAITPTFPAVNPLPGVNQTPQWWAQAYLAILNPRGTALTFASMLHGNGQYSGIGDIKLGSDGSIHVLGYSAGSKFPQVNPLTLEPLPPNSHPLDDYSSAEFLVKLAPGGSGFLQATSIYGPQYATPGIGGSNVTQKLALLPDGAPCLAGLGTRIFEQTPGGLAGLGLNDTYQQYGWTVACVDPTGTHFQTKLALPWSGVTYSDFAATTDGALLFAGTALNGQITTPGVVQPNFGGYAYTDISYPQPIPQGDAYLLRVSLENPAPALASISPSAMFLDAAVTGSTALQLYGTGFAYGTDVQFNGKPVNSVFVNSGQITVPSIDLASIQRGNNPVNVSLIGPGGGASRGTFTGINASPGDAAVSPPSVALGAPETKLVVRATNLTSDSVLYWNGQVRAASFVVDPPGKAGHFELLLEPAELVKAFAAQITVSNPGPGGGLSTPANFVAGPTTDNGVPVLYAPYNPFLFGGRTAQPGPTLSFGGSGFTSSTRAFWDGVEVQASLVSPTALKILPPAADLQRWGVHKVFVRNGAYPSATVTVFVARSIQPGTIVADPAHERVYLLASPDYEKPADLLTFDLHDGSLLNTATGIASSAMQMAMSVDGQYLYFNDQVLSQDGKSWTLYIRRYNCATAKVDLVWQPLSSFEAGLYSITNLLTPAGSAETLIVQLSSNSSTFTHPLRIFDRDKPRPIDSSTLGLYVEGTAYFATGERIYNGILPIGGRQCWQWVTYDSTGVNGGQTQCSSTAPDAVYDSGLTYLTDGERTYAVSMPAQQAPQYACLSTPAGLVVDLARRHVYGVRVSCGNSYGPVFDYSLDSQQLQTKIPYSLPQLWITKSGGLLAANAGYIMLVP